MEQKAIIWGIIQYPDIVNFILGCIGSFIAELYKIKKIIGILKEPNPAKGSTLNPLYLILVAFIIIAGGFIAAILNHEANQIMVVQSCLVGLATETLIAKGIKKGAEL